MALDMYGSCPGGTNKKIKFCGCKDILRDLDDLTEAVRGGQRAAVLSRVNRLVQAHGNRACLLALRGIVQLQLADFSALADTAEAFLQAHPQNAVALGFSAIVAAVKGQRDAAVDLLQQALAAQDEQLHEVVWEAMGIVGQFLLQLHDVLPAQGHLMLCAALGEADDSHAIQALLGLHRATSIPLLLKQNYRFERPPAGAPWTEQWEAVQQLAGRGIWVEACQKLIAMTQQYPQAAVLWKNLAVLRGWLGQLELAVEAWRKYASSEDVPLDEAVDAEAVAQMLSSDDQPSVDEVVQTYTITDADQAMERLLSEKRLSAIPVELHPEAQEDSPPPKGAFCLLDRELPASGQNIRAEDVPSVLGEVYLFGRETDREARLEFAAAKTADFDTKIAGLRELLGELVGPLEEEQTLQEVPAVAAAVAQRWYLPRDTPLIERERVIRQKRREFDLNVWPETPLPELDGRRPSEVADDPAYRVRLLAAILLREMAEEQGGQPLDGNELRAKLGLPLRQDIQRNGREIFHVPLSQLHLLAPEGLSDDDLMAAYEQAYTFNARRALLRLGAEIVRRGSLEQRIDSMAVYDTLARAAFTTDEALAQNAKGRELALSRGVSPAPWLLHELELRLARGEGEQCARLINRLNTNHLEEPGVAQALQSVYIQLGLLTPDGQPSEALVQHRDRMQAAPVAQSEPGPAEGGLWTPDAAGPPPDEKEKPKIWVPGMD